MELDNKSVSCHHDGTIESLLTDNRPGHNKRLIFSILNKI